MLYSASWKQSNKYYDYSDDKQYPYDGTKVEEDKAQKPQDNKNHSNNEKKIKCSHFQKPYLPLTRQSILRCVIVNIQLQRIILSI
jgi:hypothetical protein